MGTHHVSLTEAKQTLGELVRRVAYGKERFVLEFRGKPRAALVSCEDMERIWLAEDRIPGGSMYSLGSGYSDLSSDEETVLADLDALREEIAAQSGMLPDSAQVLDEVRQERVNELPGLC